MSVADLAAAPWADAVMGAACTVNVALARPRGGMSEEEAQRSFDALLDGREHKEWPADGGGVEEDL